MAYYAGSSVSALAFAMTAIMFKWALDNPVGEPPPLGAYFAHVLTTPANTPYGLLLIVVVTGYALAGRRIGRRFRRLSP